MKKRLSAERGNIRQHIDVFLSVMICFALFSFWPTAYAAAPTNKMASAAVEQYAQQQANALGTSDPDWIAAKLEYYPLGPGTHGWFVQASIQDKPVGYMIISINAKGQLLLSEYGQGEQSLYNNELLGQALERQDLDLNTLQASGGKLTRQYMSPLLAYWKVEPVNDPAMYIDASNGDLLPRDRLQRLEKSPETNTFDFTEQQKPQIIPTATTWITSPVIIQPVVDPSLQLSWLTSEPLQPSEVQQQIQYSHVNSPAKSHTDALIFSAGERNLFYGGPLPISAYQLWHTKTATKFETGSVLYAGLGGLNSIQRFVPFNKLMNDGHFYALKIPNSS